MAAEARMDHSRALLQGDMDRAKTCVEQLAAVDESEAEYRYRHVCTGVGGGGGGGSCFPQPWLSVFTSHLLCHVK